MTLSSQSLFRWKDWKQAIARRGNTKSFNKDEKVNIPLLLSGDKEFFCFPLQNPGPYLELNVFWEVLVAGKKEKRKQDPSVTTSPAKSVQKREDGKERIPSENGFT